MKKIRLTMAQALVRHLAAQRIRTAAGSGPLFHGVFAIFGHGNVAGIGEALAGSEKTLPTFRAHNEQAMAHAAIAFAKANQRRRLMACTTSVGPGATNLVTAAALAHSNRLPVLLLPGDTFAGRPARPRVATTRKLWRPDRQCQRLPQTRIALLGSHHAARTIARFAAAGDLGTARCSQLRSGDARAAPGCAGGSIRLPGGHFSTSACTTLSGHDRIAHGWRRQCVADQVVAATAHRRGGRRAHYSGAASVLAEFAARHGIPVAETQAGKGTLPWNHPCNAGGLGVTGSSAANRLLSESDLVLALGTRLQDFTTGSGKLVHDFDSRLIAINVARHDAIKRGALAVRGDLLATLEELAPGLEGWAADRAWGERTPRARFGVEPRSRCRNTCRAGAANGCAGTRSRQSCAWRRSHRRLRRGRPARRAAQALALPRSRRLSRRVRLFLHGL